MTSLASRLAFLPKEEKAKLLAGLSPEAQAALAYNWDFWQRPDQREPEGDWSTWLVLAGRGYGKGFDVETPIPTPTGWAKIGDLCDGDEVFDEAGKVCRVIKAHEPYQAEEHIFYFSDGSTIGACLDHQWVTWTHAERRAFLRSPYEDTSSFPENWPQWRLKRIVGKGSVISEERLEPALADVAAGMSMRDAEKKHGVHRLTIAKRLRNGPIKIEAAVYADSPGPRIRTTAGILATLTQGKRGDTNHCIPCCGALDLPDLALPIDPYALGYWIGNGTHNRPEVSGHAEDYEEFKKRVVCASVRFDARGSQTFVARCPSLRLAPSLCPDKKVPAFYLRASARQRLALLRGLLDSDGYAPKDSSNNVEFCSTKEHIAQDVAELATSLGQKPIIGIGRAMLNGVDYGPKWRVKWRPTINPFSMPRKANKITSTGAGQSLRNHHRMISNVEPTGRMVWMRCLTVDSPNSMYLAGKAMVPTHNTRLGAEWVRKNTCGITPLEAGKCRRIAIVAETAADARDVLVEGESGLLAVHPKDHRPLFEPSKRRLTWPNGAVATLYNATEPDQLRGPQHDLAFCDELAKWKYCEDTYNMLMFGLRLGTKPRKLITTTPRPLRIFRDLMDDPTTHVTRGSTLDNSDNLPPSFLKTVYDRYAGTRLGRQELEGEILDDVPGALWTRKLFDEHRVKKWADLPAMKRVIVSIDPAAKASADTDETAETGIIVAGLGADGRGYVLDDVSCREGPEGWARMAIAAYDRYEADAIVVETNQGGDMIKTVIRNVRPELKVIEVHASRGKTTRAEPISGLYAQGKVSHLGSLPILEDQMILVTPFGLSGSGLMDRVDSLVWALTELMIKGQGVIRMPQQARRHMPSHVGRSRFTGY